MKKLIALLLALLLAAVNVAALASEPTGTIPGPDTSSVQNNPDSDGEGEPASEPKVPHFVKKYDTNVTGVVPTEEIEFSVTAGANNPDSTMIHINNDSNKVNVSSAETTINVVVPTAGGNNFTKPGQYTYKVKEIAGSSQGTATYDDTEITVDVYVVYDDAGATQVLGTNVYTKVEGEGESATKKDEITNVYEVGNLTVSKAIDGNLADPNLEFTFEVVFTPASGKTVNSDITISGTGTASGDKVNAAGTTLEKNWNSAQTITVVVKGGENVQFANIPAGVTYTVTEKKAGEADIKDIEKDVSTQLAEANNPAAYNVTTEYDDTAKAIAKNDADTVKVTNYKGIEIPTGIALDTLPYVLIMAVALLGLVRLAARKRKEY